MYIASVAVSGTATIDPAEPYIASWHVYSFCCSIRNGYDRPGRTQQQVENVNDCFLRVTKSVLRNRSHCFQADSEKDYGFDHHKLKSCLDCLIFTGWYFCFYSKNENKNTKGGGRRRMTKNWFFRDDFTFSHPSQVKTTSHFEYDQICALLTEIHSEKGRMAN